MRDFDWPRGVVSAVVLLIFGYAYLNNPDDEMMKGALIAAFSSAVAYWLGSSKGSSDKTALLGNGHTQKVEVTNTPADPVHTQPIEDGELPESQKL